MPWVLLILGRKKILMPWVLLILGTGAVYFYRNRVVDTYVANDGKYELRANGVVVDPHGNRIIGVDWERIKNPTIPGPGGVL